MPGNSALKPAEGIDRRKARTRQALVRAFTSLVFEHRYDDFGVSEIVERANVGRSTYYEHFGSKDALLRASMSGLLGVLADAAAGDADRDRLDGVVAHFWENRRLARTVFGAPLRAPIERQLAEMVEDRVGPGKRLAATQIAAAQLAALDAWVSGTATATIDEIGEAMIATGRLG